MTSLLHGTLTKMQWLLLYLEYHFLNRSFIYFLLSAQYRSRYSKSQAAAVFVDHNYTMVANTVLVSYDCVITGEYPLHSKIKLLAVDLLEKPSKRQTFHEKLDLIVNSWKKTLRSRYTSAFRQWFVYATSSFYPLLFKRYI